MKKSIKCHFESHTHKSNIVDIENKGRYDINDNNAAAMICARLCLYLFKKGRPFTDYPDLVATIVAGGTYTGETNYSTHFPSTYLSSVANVVREKITTYLKTPLKHCFF